MHLLKFYTDDCYPCRVMQPIVIDACDKTGVELYNIRADDWLAEVFEVTAVPTLVLMKDGKELKRTQGIVGAGMLVKWIEED